MKYLFLLLFLFLHILSYSQEYKRNNNWTLGFSRVSIFNFNDKILNIDTIENKSLSLIVNACISDTNGKLCLISSGFVILQSDGFLMENGMAINCPFGDKLAKREGYISPYE